MTKIVRCAQCGKVLFFTDQEDEMKIGLEADSKGFIFKFPFLYGRTDKIITCTKECWRDWFDENIPEADKQKGREALKRMKDDLPQAIVGTQKAVSEFVDIISHIRNEVEKGRSLNEVLNDHGLEEYKKAIQERIKNSEND